jgi:hypothetical protein
MIKAVEHITPERNMCHTFLINLSVSLGYKDELITHVRKIAPIIRKNKDTCTRFEVLTALTMKSTVFWDMTLCSGRVCQYLGGTYVVAEFASTWEEPTVSIFKVKE